MTMIWPLDKHTARAAKNYPLPIQANVPAAQFPGYKFNPHRGKWPDRVIDSCAWPIGHLVSCPHQIIQLFQGKHYLEALAMVVSWGKMWRRPEAIYGNRPLEDIQVALQQCSASIAQTHSIQGAWQVLTERLGWSGVITSKTLHFLSRALIFEQDPPVTIDNKVKRDCVWPAFINPIPVPERPQDWHGSSLDAYYRYMTAILVWTQQRGWTTTQMEAKVFRQYR